MVVTYCAQKFFVVVVVLIYVVVCFNYLTTTTKENKKGFSLGLSGNFKVGFSSASCKKI